MIFRGGSGGVPPLFAVVWRRFFLKKVDMQKVCLDCAGVYGSHMGPPIKLQFGGFCVIFFLFGRDPEKMAQILKNMAGGKITMVSVTLPPTKVLQKCHPFWSHF